MQDTTPAPISFEHGGETFDVAFSVNALCALEAEFSCGIAVLGERIAGLPAASRPTAAFCANDLLALGLLQRCVTLGLRVPQDLAIVGYDDIDFAGAAAVPLTSVRQPRRRLGRTAAELLLDEATNVDHEHQQVTFTPELVARASTRG